MRRGLDELCAEVFVGRAEVNQLSAESNPKLGVVRFGDVGGQELHEFSGRGDQMVCPQRNRCMHPSRRHAGGRGKIFGYPPRCLSALLRREALTTLSEHDGDVRRLLLQVGDGKTNVVKPGVDERVPPAGPLSPSAEPVASTCSGEGEDQANNYGGDYG